MFACRDAPARTWLGGEAAPRVALGFWGGLSKQPASPPGTLPRGGGTGTGAGALGPPRRTRRGEPVAVRRGMRGGRRGSPEPYLRAGGRLPAARSLRAAGGAWSCPRPRRALPLPAAARRRRRSRLGSDGLSSVPGSSRGGGDNGEARDQHPAAPQPSTPAPARGKGVSALLSASPPADINPRPAPAPLIYNFSTPRRAPPSRPFSPPLAPAPHPPPAARPLPARRQPPGELPQGLPEPRWGGTNPPGTWGCLPREQT